MTLKTATAKILQITGLITAITGCAKSLIDLFGLAMPPRMEKVAMRYDPSMPHPPPPPPPPESFWNEYTLILGPVIVIVGIVLFRLARTIKKSEELAEIAKKGVHEDH